MALGLKIPPTVCGVPPSLSPWQAALASGMPKKDVKDLGALTFLGCPSGDPTVHSLATSPRTLHVWRLRLQ